MSGSPAAHFPRPILGCLLRMSGAPQSKPPGVSRIPLMWEDGKDHPLQLISTSLGDPETPLLGLSSTLKSSRQKAPSHQASGLHGGVVPWQPLLDNQPSSERPSWGSRPWEQDQEGGSGRGRGGGVGSQPGPLGGRTHCQLSTHNWAQLCWDSGTGRQAGAG